MAGKVLVIGIDGATWDLIEPWARAGKLPTFKRLMDEGAWGTLRCPIPPISAQSWASFATGKNPAKHGFLDFVEVTPYSYSTRFVNSRMLGAKTLWRLLGEAGRTVGVLNVPVTYPPEPVNGFMITGYPTPGIASPFVHPAELRSEFLGAVPGYRIECSDVELPRFSRRAKLDVFLDKLLDMMDNRLAATRWLYARFKPDFFMPTFTAFDRVCHYYWKYMDPALRDRFSDEEIERYGDAILRIHQRQDEIIAELLEMIEPGTSVFMLSDHGFGPSYDRLNIHGWFVENGYLVPKHEKRRLISRAIDAVISNVIRFTPVNFRTRIKERFPAVADRAISRVFFHDIDWTRTRAYTVGEYRSIYINLKGRQPQGIVSPGAEYEALRDELIEKLSALRDPRSNEPIIQRVYRREEVYSGAFLERMPDLVIDWEYRYSFSVDFSTGPLVSSVLDAKRLHWAKSGYHRPNGIFLAHGPDIERGKRVEGVVMDVTATILYAMGLPIPHDMDGHVITDAFTPERIASAPPRTAEADTSAAPDSTEVYSPDEEAEVTKRLRELGYLE